MEPFEIMVSESQERMLCVVRRPSRVDEVLAVCAKWEVHGTAIGEVTDTRHAARAARRRGRRRHARRRARRRLPALRPRARSARPSRSTPPPTATLARRTRRCTTTLLALLALAEPRLAPPAVRAVRLRSCSRAPSRRPEEADAAVLALPDGGAHRRVDRRQRPPRRRRPLPRARSATCWSARRTSPASAPSRSGMTNNLNFGNPEKPHIAWQLTEAVRGLGDACRALGVPVVGGNVSLYNEGADGPIYPTPVVGMVGELPDPRAPARLGFVARGRRVALGGLEPHAVARRLRAGQAARRAAARRAARVRPRARSSGARRRSATPSAPATLASCHDVAEGGFAGRRRRGLPGRRRRRDAADSATGRPPRRAVRRGRLAASSSPATRAALDAPRRARAARRLRHRRRRRARASAASSWTLQELRAAHGALASLFP